MFVCFVMVVYFIYLLLFIDLAWSRMMEPHEKDCLFYRYTCLKTISISAALHRSTPCRITALCRDWPVKGKQTERSRGEKRAYFFANTKGGKRKNSRNKNVFSGGVDRAVRSRINISFQLPVVPSGPGPIHTSQTYLHPYVYSHGVLD